MANTMKPSHIWKRTRIIPCHLSCWLLLIRTAATVPKRSTRPRRWRTLMIPGGSRPWLSRPSVPATRIQPAAEASTAAKSNSNAGGLVPCLCDALVLTLGTEKPSPATHEHDGRTGWRYSGRSLCLLRPYSCPPSLLSLRDSFAGGCRESALWMVPSPRGSVAREPIQRSGRTAQEVGVYIANGVSALMPAPREQNPELRDICPADRETCRKAVAQVVEVEITASERDFSVVRHRRESQRQFPKRVLESSTRKHHVRGAKAVILITAQGSIAIEVGASHCRLEVERHDVACRCD